jgi:phosphoribosylformylglycinamidine synthase subunit PurSL
MAYRLEISMKPDLFDAEGEGIRQKARNYFNIELSLVRTINVVTIDAALTPEQLETVRTEIFTNPVTQVSSFNPLPLPFDWTIWVGYRPGVRDNAGSTAAEAIEEVLGRAFGKAEAVYTSKRYCVQGDHLTVKEMDRIAGEFLANDIIQQWKIFSSGAWDPKVGCGLILPKVRLDHQPTVTQIPITSDAVLAAVSDERNLALNPRDIPTIRAYFLNPEVLAERATVGLSDPTDIELEYISQARSDHCNHNTFQGVFRYKDLETGEASIENSLFKTYIEAPTLQLKEKKDWVVSVLWDNAGVGRFSDDYYYVITGETHNSPSNMEAYGGAITGIVGVYRDPLGTGKGSKLVMGSYGFCVGNRDYSGDLKPRLHPRRLLDGVIEGVRDGGNKSGIPTTFGQVLFHSGYMGKCLVFVTAVGVMPAAVNGLPTEQKRTTSGDLLIMSGGRVGKDGIHGVTASSEVFSEHTPAGHVQIGDPYTQKKMHDFLLVARDEDLIEYITDNGGGGLSSSIGESARLSNGCEVDLEKVPLKYEGLDQWEIWISESQERMTIAIRPENLDRFMALSKLHAVESTVIGRYTDSGKLHIRYNGITCAYVNMDLLTARFPKWEFEAEWKPPELRGLYEPVIREPRDYNRLLTDLMARPNICDRHWVTRQYDHEVQGGSVIKPLVGEARDVPSDAVVSRPILEVEKGLVFTQALIPAYSAIDAYHMTTSTIDEAVRRLLSVGANPDHIGGVDNFCWPSIQYHPTENPDGKFKAAQLVRSCKALRDMCLAYEIPLLSGKDSMYVDGHLEGRYGERHKVSALETLQFSATSIIDDLNHCVSMDAKVSGDLIYVLGVTKNELGASEYYEHWGYIGTQVPQVAVEMNRALYRSLFQATRMGLLASIHGVYRGGLGVHVALVAMAGNLGMEIDLSKAPSENVDRDDVLLFSESAGRFIVTIDPANREAFEKQFTGLPIGCIGRVSDVSGRLIIKGAYSKMTDPLITLTVEELKSAWMKPFGELI